MVETIDRLTDQDFRQWQAVTDKLADRQRRHASSVLGAPDVGSFHTDRERLIESVGREAQRVVDTYDKQREAATLADEARVAVATAAAAGGAALGLGTLVTVAASTVAADVTGILLASVIAGIGFLVIPARRRRAKAHLQNKITALRARLTESLATQFEQAQARSAERLAGAVAPYSRSVRAEDARWQEARTALTAIDTERQHSSRPTTSLIVRFSRPSVTTLFAGRLPRESRSDFTLRPLRQRCRLQKCSIKIG